MTYAVIWRMTAIVQLGRIRASAPDPIAIDRAAAFMDYLLRRIPRNVGESRTAGFRVWYEDTLGLFYRIDEDNMRVEVLYAGPARRH